MSDDSIEPNITKYKKNKAIKSLKNQKSTEFDNITTGEIKAGRELMIISYVKFLIRFCEKKIYPSIGHR